MRVALARPLYQDVLVFQQPAHGTPDRGLVDQHNLACVLQQKVERHIAAQGFYIVRDKPDLATRLAHPRVVRVVWGAGYPPARTPMDDPFARRATATVAAAIGQPPVRMPSLGGSIPMYLFARGGTPVIGLPIANHDDNQHAANENLRLANLWNGIEVYAALFGALEAR